MFEELQYLELSGEKYPIKCDLIVLEKIQETYGSLEKYELGLMPWVPIVDKNGNEVEKRKSEERSQKWIWSINL